jgi:glycosyltransferase involved in cell wall biosynthesis
MMRIGLFTPMLLATTPGGAERATTDLARAMYDRGHNVFLFYNVEFDFSRNKPFYRSSFKIPTHRLPLPHEARYFDQAGSLLHSLGLDVFCALVWDNNGALCAELLKKSGTPFVYAERNEPHKVRHGYWNEIGHALTVNRAARIVLQIQSYMRAYPERLHDRITVIPNAVRTVYQTASPGGGTDGNILLAVGRMEEEQKQFSFLIAAFAGLADKFPHWRLHLCGDGPDLSAYKELAVSLKLGDKVVFRGNVQNIDAEYAAAQLFCIPSAYEGFSNVLGEAQRHGLPAVGFAACPGVSELIVNERNGLLAPDMTVDALRACLLPLMASAQLRRLMGAKAELDARAYLPERVYQLWEETLAAAAERPAPAPDTKLPSNTFEC